MLQIIIKFLSANFEYNFFIIIFHHLFFDYFLTKLSTYPNILNFFNLKPLIVFPSNLNQSTCFIVIIEFHLMLSLKKYFQPNYHLLLLLCFNFLIPIS